MSEARKALFAGMHFSNPVPTMKMCEVVFTPETSEETVATVVGLGERVGKNVSLVKDMPETYGFLLNRDLRGGASGGEPDRGGRDRDARGRGQGGDGRPQLAGGVLRVAGRDGEAVVVAGQAHSQGGGGSRRAA